MAEGPGRRELHVTPKGNYDLVLRHELNGYWAYTLEAQGGHLMIGHADSADQGIAIWRGRWHEVATWLADPKMAPELAARRFENLRFTDTAGGLLIESTRPAVDKVEVADVDTYVPGAGYLTIMPPTSGIDLVPRWSGAPVASGEVWIEDEPIDDDDKLTVLHVSETAVTRVCGSGMDGNEAVLPFVEKITRVSWSSASAASVDG
ncbi:hypothetical protein [Phytoactinopolyspora limicola]|uniref:hypothetical protein n=1 Tax=Phytoactinopolyspora limicola TaxID=2715536 RepID=UPI001407C3E5|nr:hypothetical protein [Phytoactinopolyspora limicola]